MNKIESVEQFSSVLSDVLATLTQRGDVAIPCPTPQPWADRTFHPTFEADAPRWVVPEWRFSCYPLYSRSGEAMRFDGLRLSVHVSDSTMDGRYKNAIVIKSDEISVALETLVAFRDQALKACRHKNHRFVANLGRCYYQYQCNDCGVKFNIDSGD